MISPLRQLTDRRNDKKEERHGNLLPVRDHNYFIYIVTNKNKTVLYLGVTNDLQRRVFEHENGIVPGFSKRYNCQFLIYFEHFQKIKEAIVREKEIKKWRREKKEKLINEFNPRWTFLNERIYDSL